MGCSSQKNRLIPPLLLKLAFTSGPPLKKNGFYLLCSSQKNRLIPPLLFKLAFTSGPPLRKKWLLPPLLFTKKSAYTSFAFQTGIYLGTPPSKKTAFTSFALHKKIGLYLLCFSNWHLPRDP